MGGAPGLKVLQEPKGLQVTQRRVRRGHTWLPGSQGRLSPSPRGEQELAVNQRGRLRAESDRN